MSERSKDWLAQAERDLSNAEYESNGRFYEWACFSAQQAAEKAVKAVYQKKGGAAWGHSITVLLKGLDTKIDNTLRQSALILDKLYLPSRYPNGFAEGSPKDFITKEDAGSAIDSAKKILKFCHDILV